MKLMKAMAAAASGCAQVKTNSVECPVNGTFRCSVKIGVRTPGIKKLKKIMKPAAIVEMEAGLPTRLFIQPNRNPHVGPSPRVRYTYGPPALGIAAPSSATVNAP